jgi:hypothetical protein
MEPQGWGIAGAARAREVVMTVLVALISIGHKPVRLALE